MSGYTGQICKKTVRREGNTSDAQVDKHKQLKVVRREHIKQTDKFRKLNITVPYSIDRSMRRTDEVSFILPSAQHASCISLEECTNNSSQ